MKVHIDTNQNATVEGDYSTWLELRKACERLGFPPLAEHSLVGEPHNIKRIVVYLNLYWSQIRGISRKAAWYKLAQLADCVILREPSPNMDVVNGLTPGERMLED